MVEIRIIHLNYMINVVIGLVKHSQIRGSGFYVTIKHRCFQDVPSIITMRIILDPLLQTRINPRYWGRFPGISD